MTLSLQPFSLKYLKILSAVWKQNFKYIYIYIRNEVWRPNLITENFDFACYLYYLARRTLSFTLEITITRTTRMVENCDLLGYYAASSGKCNYHYSLRNNRMRAVWSTSRRKP